MMGSVKVTFHVLARRQMSELITLSHQAWIAVNSTCNQEFHHKRSRLKNVMDDSDIVIPT